MEDIAGMVAQSIGRRMKAAQAKAEAELVVRAQAGDPRAKEMLARMQAYNAADAAGKQGRPAPALPPVAPGASVTRPAVAMGMPAPPARLAPGPPKAPSALGPDTLPGLPLSIFEEDGAPRPDLLNSFSGKGLLAGIVLSEALALPVALREGGQGSNF